MHEAVSRTTAGRVAASLFFVSGLVTVLSIVLPTPPSVNAPGVAACGLTAIFAAIPVWFIPWQRLPRRAMLVLVVFALPLISIHNVVGGSDPYRWGLFYVVLSAWVGLGQPRGTFLLLAPLVTLSYALPLIIFPGHPLWALSSTLYAIPVCGLVAESVAWAIGRAGRAQQALGESESRLRHMAHHDALTGLANRAYFLQQLSDVLAQHGPDVALLFIDIDDFKGINDRLGHAAGDELLRHVANCLVAGVRPNDMVARLGGDEFTVLLPDIRTSSAVTALAARIREQLRTPLTWEGAEVAVNASIGVTVAAPGDSADRLLSRADAAMYAAKRGGKDQAVVLDAA